MNSSERLMARIQGKPVDRIPNLNIVMQFAARQIGVPYGRYVTDARLLAQGVIHCHEQFELDCLCAISDPMREAEGFGAQVTFPEDGVPFMKQPLITDLSQIGRLKAPDPCAHRRMSDRLEAVRLLRGYGGDAVPVIGWVEGAFAEACDLMGVAEVMVNLYDEPEAMHALLEVCLAGAQAFSVMQVKEGARIVGIGDAAASLIGANLYEEFVLPYQKRLIDAIHEAGALVKLHICGNINPSLHLVAQTGADIVDLDHMVDMQRAIALLPAPAPVCGNFDPVSVLLMGDEQCVEQAVRHCAVERAICSAGCEVPPGTPDQNLRAVARTLKRLVN